MQKILFLQLLNLLLIKTVFGQIIPKKKELPNQSSPVIRVNFMAPIGVHLYGSAEFKILSKLTPTPEAGLVSAIGFYKESSAPELSNSSTVGFFPQN